MEIQYHFDANGNLTGTTMDQEYKDHVDGMERYKTLVQVVLVCGLLGLLAFGFFGLAALSWLIKVLT